MREPIINDDERQYLQMMQENICRMANYSANCKNWMVMIVAALFAVSCGSIEEMNGWLLLTILPIWLFWKLDAFYLKLERGMRNRQKLFLNICTGVEQAQKYSTALFDFTPYLFDRDLTKEEEKNGYKTTKGCWKTESVKPFYLTALLVVLIVALVLNASDLIEWIKTLFQHKAV